MGIWVGKRSRGFDVLSVVYFWNAKSFISYVRVVDLANISCQHLRIVCIDSMLTEYTTTTSSL